VEPLPDIVRFQFVHFNHGGTLSFKITIGNATIEPDNSLIVLHLVVKLQVGLVLCSKLATLRITRVKCHSNVVPVLLMFFEGPHA
jgi:hypothetical protein